MSAVQRCGWFVVALTLGGFLVGGCDDDAAVAAPEDRGLDVAPDDAAVADLGDSEGAETDAENSAETEGLADGDAGDPEDTDSADGSADAELVAETADDVDAGDAATPTDVLIAADGIDAGGPTDDAPEGDGDGQGAETADAADGSGGSDAAGGSDAVPVDTTGQGDITGQGDTTGQVDTTGQADTTGQGDTGPALDSGCPGSGDDGLACTADACNAGSCSHAPQAALCDDGNLCTTDVCDAAAGCQHGAASGACDDGDPCTLSDACAGSACLGTGAKGCGDGNACTVDSCIPGKGCSNVVSFDCNDLNSCTVDTCDAVVGCMHAILPDQAPCDDGNACTVWESCVVGSAGAPGCLGGKPLDCDDQNPCTADQCLGGSGCQHVAVAAACDDFDPCTGPDTCDGNYCVGGAAKTCASDGNPCTVDYCVSLAPPGVGDPPLAGADGCVHQAMPVGCDDGNPCSAADTCVGTSCVAGPANGCDDKNACTLDACSGGNSCSHVASASVLTCDDANACTVADTCEAVTGACKGTAAPPCSDGDDCTIDSCDPLLGCNYPDLCDDGDPCTEDACTDGSCSHSNLFAFKEDFAGGNAKGWQLDAEWQIGPAQLGPSGNIPPGDPANDHSTGADGMIAGVGIGGIAKRAAHPYLYLTSPQIDTTKVASPALEYWRWLASDIPPYMANRIEVYNGSAWKLLWESPEDAQIGDDAWTRVAHDVSAYSNKKFRFRIGFAVLDAVGVLAVASWNLDDFIIGEAGTCVLEPFAD